MENQDCAINIRGADKFFTSGLFFKKRNRVIKTLDLCVKYGELFGLLGPNGAGKSNSRGRLNGTYICG